MSPHTRGHVLAGTCLLAAVSAAGGVASVVDTPEEHVAGPGLRMVAVHHDDQLEAAG